MGASPKTTEFLKECMADSLLQLMKEKSFSKITVNEIAGTAGVNRSTWFRNFKTKNDAITFKLMQLWKRWKAEHRIDEAIRYTPENAGEFFLFAYSVKDILSAVYR
ncbi:MAG: TetR/AcrR family transcriptional regulator, partial [Acutalibacteraceae bacterium]